MTHKTNCTAYVITAINKKSGLLEGYYGHGNIFVELTASIWYAKFLMTLKSAEKYLQLCKDKMPTNNKMEDLDWKIQEVSMNAPTDVK